MSEWKNQLVTNFSTVLSGATPSTNNPTYWNGKINWITPADLSKLKTRYFDTTERKLSKEGVQNCAANLLPAFSIVMSSRAPIGYFAIGKAEFTTNQGCKSFLLKDGQDADFHYYNFVFNVNEFFRLGSGSTFAEVSKKDIETIYFKIPTSKIKQQKIARILTTIDKVIEQTENAIDKLKKIKQGMMHDLFTRGIDIKTGKLRPSCSEASKLYKKTELGWVPKEWDLMPVGDLCNLRRGASPRPIDDPKYFSKNGRGWVRISDVTSSYKYLEATKQKLSPLGESLSVPIEKGELIMSICATIGRPIIVNTPVCIHDGFVYFNNIESKLNVEYAFYFLTLKESQIKQNCQVGTQGNLNTSIVNAILCPVPVERAEQAIIAKRITTVDHRILSEDDFLNKIIKLKQGLMQNLLTGKVEVTPDPQDKEYQEAG